MKIFHISAECYPVAKVGGLADVVGALPKYQNRLGHKASVVIPAYQNKFVSEHTFETIYSNKVKLGIYQFPFTVEKEVNDILGCNLYLISIPELFDRPNIYSYEDDTERFLSFQIAFLNWISDTNQFPDILHCHDHHTGLIPFMVANCPQYVSLKNILTLITIHNAQYQGWFGFDKINYLPDFDKERSGLLEWNGIINPLASAIKCAGKVTTVSPGYLLEMMDAANGLESLLRFERQKSVGILNGIDNEVWNPATDPFIETHYSASTATSGKAKIKKQLCKTFNLDPAKPLFTFIGRLVGEKGADLIPHICSIELNSHPNEANFLILGSGDSEVEKSLLGLQNFYSGNYNVYIGYNEQLAHAIYAGADFLLMPSRVEPCGLNQMYAMRYGTVPIVRRTGGLKDTVIDMGDGGFGICHDQASVEDVLHSIARAKVLFGQDKEMKKIRKMGMLNDHSWNGVAQKYIDVYESLNNTL